MPGAIIEFDQYRPATEEDELDISYGSPGVARNDLWEGRQINCVSTVSGNTSWSWSFLDIPPGSAVTLTGASTSTAAFTPDLPGSYRVQLITNGGGPGNVQNLIAAVRYDITGVLVQRGWCIPALGEVPPEDNFSGQTRGWDAALRFIFADLLTLFNTLGNQPTVITPVSGSYSALEVQALITTYGYAYLSIDCSTAPVEIYFPLDLAEGVPITLYFAKGDPSSYNVTIYAPDGSTLYHPNTRTSTLQDTPTASFVYNDALDLGNTYEYMVDANGNFTVH